MDDDAAGLLPQGKQRQLDGELRKQLILYGELSQVCYDYFDQRAENVAGSGAWEASRPPPPQTKPTQGEEGHQQGSGGLRDAKEADNQPRGDIEALPLPPLGKEGREQGRGGLSDAKEADAQPRADIEAPPLSPLEGWGAQQGVGFRGEETKVEPQSQAPQGAAAEEEYHAIKKMVDRVKWPIEGVRVHAVLYNPLSRHYPHCHVLGPVASCLGYRDVPQTDESRAAVLELYLHDKMEIEARKDSKHVLPKDRTAFIGYIIDIPIKDYPGGGREIVVAFRGTVTTEEWLLDADAYKDLQNPETSWHKMHPGFFKYYNGDGASLKNSPRGAVEEVLFRVLLEDVAGEIKAITFTGHSLGGAIAQIALHSIERMKTLVRDQKDFAQVERLWEEVDLAVYTFAAPKVGSQSMWGDVRPRSLNVCNVRDVVPCAPFRGVTAVGAFVDGIIKLLWCLLVCCPASSWPTWKEQHWLWWSLCCELWRRLRSVVNHLLMGGFCQRYDTNREYFDPSVRLYIDSRESKVVRPCYGALSDWSLRHNLEHMLYMLSNQYAATKRDVVWRDLALLNKGGDLLRKDLAQALGIPADWWCPSVHSGLEEQSFHNETMQKCSFYRKPKRVRVGGQGSGEGSLRAAGCCCCCCFDHYLVCGQVMTAALVLVANAALPKQSQDFLRTTWQKVLWYVGLVAVGVVCGSAPWYIMHRCETRARRQRAS